MIPYSQRPWLHTELFDNAARFFRNLNPVDGILGGTYRGPPYIYRGVSLAEKHDLVPSALRGDARLLTVSGWQDGPLSQNLWQIEAEANTLRQFFRLADAKGLALPEDSQHLRSMLETVVSDEYLDKVRSGDCSWPPRQLLSLLAIAQHHGIATRLLDWTWDPYVAAYFAAKGAKPPFQNEHIAVWALNRSYIRGLREEARIVAHIVGNPEPDPATKETITIVTAPGSGNNNLQAQKGLFLLYRLTEIDMEAEPRTDSYDSLLSAELGLEHETDPVVFRLTLSADEAPELLRMLSIAGINAATLFPGFSGAADALNEMGVWPDEVIWEDRYKSAVDKKAKEFRQKVRNSRAQA